MCSNGTAKYGRAVHVGLSSTCWPTALALAAHLASNTARRARLEICVSQVLPEYGLGKLLQNDDLLANAVLRNEDYGVSLPVPDVDCGIVSLLCVDMPWIVVIQGEAEARLVMAKAEAEALQTVAEALKDVKGGDAALLQVTWCGTGTQIIFFLPKKWNLIAIRDDFCSIPVAIRKAIYIYWYCSFTKCW